MYRQRERVREGGGVKLIHVGFESSFLPVAHWHQRVLGVLIMGQRFGIWAARKPGRKTSETLREFEKAIKIITGQRKKLKRELLI